MSAPLRRGDVVRFDRLNRGDIFRDEKGQLFMKLDMWGGKRQLQPEFNTVHMEGINAGHLGPKMEGEALVAFARRPWPV